MNLSGDETEDAWNRFRASSLFLPGTKEGDDADDDSELFAEKAVRAGEFQE
jgi:hypothetical protein